ncbi:MAG: phage/plasmid primase, P4 family [Chloroflexota bacterium]|nr:phage/plasmid primase, P4 family [Chloroflexota bacterium]
MSIAHTSPPHHLDAILSSLQNVKTRAGGWVARCPAHDDTVQSLKIDLNADEHVMLFCHAGCDTRAVVEKIGLTMSDLFKPAPTPTNLVSMPKKEVAAYVYRDSGGNPLFEVVRFAPKSFGQRTPDKKWGLNGVEPVLYHLPELLAAPPNRPIFVCAGEKDADRLAGEGLVATTNPMGEGKGKWRAQYTDTLRDRQVVLLCDNDKTGIERGDEVGSLLSNAVKTLRVIHFPGLPDHGDVSDWLDAGKTITDLLNLVKTTPNWHEQAQAEVVKSISDNNPTDLGNAQRLIQRHGADLRYSYKLGKWLVWTDGVWKVDEGGLIEHRAKDTVKSIYAEAADQEFREDRKKLASHALRSEADGKIKAMISLARSEPNVSVTIDDLDTDGSLLNVQNGIVDLRTGTLMPHDRAKLMTKMAPVAYDPSALCPYWDAFLTYIMDDNADLLRFLQKALGYSLTGNASERVIFLLHGGGRNGKSTLIETVNAVMGNYATRSPSEMLMAKRGDPGVPNDIARLPGIRFTFASETGENGRLDEARIKDITSGDTLSARFMKQDFFEFKPQFKIWLATNHKPVITGGDDAIWDRIRLIPFTVRIPDDHVDLDLQDTLITESAGILRWLVEGAVAWFHDRLPVVSAVTTATSGYRSDMDTLGAFLSDFTVIDALGEISSADLYTDYKGWCDESGEYTMSQKKLAMRLEERGFHRKRVTRKRVWTWFGLRRRTELDDVGS